MFWGTLKFYFAIKNPVLCTFTEVSYTIDLQYTLRTLLRSSVTEWGSICKFKIPAQTKSNVIQINNLLVEFPSERKSGCEDEKKTHVEVVFGSIQMKVILQYKRLFLEKSCYFLHECGFFPPSLTRPQLADNTVINPRARWEDSFSLCFCADPCHLRS